MTEDLADNLPAVRDVELDRLARLGQWLALSESGATDAKALGAAAALRLYYAEQLGLPPLAAAELSVIKGRLFVSAQLLRALAEDRGYRVDRVDATDQTCTAILSKAGVELGRATFTIVDAKTAGLIRNGSAWQTHPGRMLWARASKNVIVDFAPAVALGLALDDEAAEIAADEKPLPPPSPPPPPVIDVDAEEILEAENIPFGEPDERAQLTVKLLLLARELPSKTRAGENSHDEMAERARRHRAATTEEEHLGWLRRTIQLAEERLQELELQEHES